MSLCTACLCARTNEQGGSRGSSRKGSSSVADNPSLLPLQCDITNVPGLGNRPGCADCRECWFNTGDRITVHRPLAGRHTCLALRQTVGSLSLLVY